MNGALTKAKWLAVAALALLFADCLVLSPLFLRLSAYRHDPVLGWLPKENFSRSYLQKDREGNEYQAQLTLNRLGFRAYGNAESRHPKLLFVGDSYTGDPYTGNDEMYFSVVAAALYEKFGIKAETFATGAGGYSTLQEYLLIRERIPVIKPDVFVLQFCENDFHNNLFEWEGSGVGHNQHLLRPYLATGTGRLFYADSAGARLYRYLYRHFFLFRRLDAVVQKLRFRYHQGYFPKPDAREQQRLEAKSFQVTREILALFRKEFPPHTRLFLALDATGGPELERQLRLAEEAGFVPLLAPARSIKKALDQGAVVHHADGAHLNILGNRLFGESLASELATHLAAGR